MKWRVSTGDILDFPADAIICSANPNLNLSGGVGGALLLRYGPAMQQRLRDYLNARGGRRYIDQGEVVCVSGEGTPYRCIIHAVAVDTFYDSSPAIVASVVAKALRAAAAFGAQTVALTALGTGYGKLTIAEFAEGLRSIEALDVLPVESVTVVVPADNEADELCAALETLERET